MSDPARHRDHEARAIERCTFFGKPQNKYTHEEKLLTDIWLDIIDERIEMLPERASLKEGPQVRYGRIIQEVAL